MTELFLEEALDQCEEDRNIIVYLSSAHAIYRDPEEEPVYLPDTLGNHTAKNWLTAIQNNNLEKTFTVKAVVDKASESTPDQIAVYVDAVSGDKEAQVLEIEANRAGLEALFH